MHDCESIRGQLPIPTSEQLAPGHKSEWKLWKSLNRLRMGMGRSKNNLSKWGYADTADTACECGTPKQTMQHLLRCPLLENECSLEDLATANEKALHCARAWPNIWLSSGMMDTKEEQHKWYLMCCLICINKTLIWMKESSCVLNSGHVFKIADKANYFFGKMYTSYLPNHIAIHLLLNKLPL